MRGRAVVQIAIFVVIAGALGYAVVKSADGWADWVVFGVVVCAALGGAIAVWNRQYPVPNQKRTFTRDSESNW
jgi:hypothetical protein